MSFLYKNIHVNSLLSDPQRVALSNSEMLIAIVCGVPRRAARPRHPLLIPPERMGILFDLRELLLQKKQDASRSQILNAD